MQELHIVLTPNKELEEVFPNVPVSGFRNGKSFKEFLVRARLPVLNASGRFDRYGKIFFFGFLLYKHCYDLYNRSLPENI